MTYVASPDRAKYGLLLTLFASGKADILWEGHAFPYICNPGDTVYEPFAGIGSTCYQALKMGRKTYGVELNPNYFRFAVGYCERAVEKLDTPTLFDLAAYTAKAS